MSRRRKRRHKLSAMTEINVTPLMDLTFLLLIVFMITAPMLEYGVDVSPPKMNAQVLDDPESVVITISASGNVVFRKKAVSIVELKAEMRGLSISDPSTVVLIRADEGRPYGEVVNVMKCVKNAGIANVSLVTQPDEQS